LVNLIGSIGLVRRGGPSRKDLEPRRGRRSIRRSSGGSGNGAIEEPQEGFASVSDAREAGQRLADRDQALADADQAGSDSDQTAAGRERAAADSDQAASDRDLAHGGDPDVHRRSRDDRGCPPALQLIETALAADPERCEIKVGFAALAAEDSAAELIRRADAELPASGQQ